jgi:DNA-binding NarL/FixJ family response regulator
MTGNLLLDLNLKVLVMDRDFYALHAVNSVLAYDRRTRVTRLTEHLSDMWAYIQETPLAERPDVVLLDDDNIAGGVKGLMKTIADLRSAIPGVRVICLSQVADVEPVDVAAKAGAVGFLLKQEVRYQIAWAIVETYRQGEFIITRGSSHLRAKGFHDTRLLHARVLPGRKVFPDLTGRIAQALDLCVLKGMPAILAADEMGISLNTIRGYIRDGYRILEAYDEDKYPDYLTPQERAFMRLTAFASDDSQEAPAAQVDGTLEAATAAQ